MKQKILLVGEPRICPQVAYVMDWQDFEMVEQLTDAEKYRDYKIVICSRKKERKRFIKTKVKTLEIIYFDDICRELDAEAALTKSAQYKLMGIKSVPFWQRVIDRIKNREVGVAIIRRMKRHVALRNFKIINRLPVESLRLSEMFIKVLYSRPTNIACNQLLFNGTISGNFNLCGCCCADWVAAFGNLQDADLSTVYNSRRARIIKLSALNHSYCFCNLHYCTNTDFAPKPITDLLPLSTLPLPQNLTLSFDGSCNLRCIMCRKDYYNADTATQETINKWVDTITNSEWLQQIPYITLAGDGEVFYSQAYQKLLHSNIKRKQIRILSNGTLFNASQWEKVKAKYEQIDVTVSVDAATPVTYQKIRGGNFTKLMENLTLLSTLRQSNAIREFRLHFVVQKDNCHEMAGFVKLAKELHVDRVIFLHLNRGGIFVRGQYRKIEKYLANQLPTILQDPIFSDPIVDLTVFKKYLLPYR